MTEEMERHMQGFFRSDGGDMARKKSRSIAILVVDDEPGDRTTVRDVLKSEGYTVLEAESSSDAMAVFDLKRDSVQLLVADVSLPDGNGCSLAISMRKQKSNLRVLFISYYVGSEICKHYGLDVDDLHFLAKPFTAAQLSNRVEEVLSSRTSFPKIAAPKVFTSKG